MTEEFDVLIAKMLDKSEENALIYSNKLALTNDSEVQNRLLEMLYDKDDENMYLAARTLSHMPGKSSILDDFLSACHDKKNQHRNGALVDLLENFDVSDKFVDIFRLFLNGNFKVSMLAKQMLDYATFDISPRTIRKAEKHLEHFLNNIDSNDSTTIKASEAAEILQELKELFDDSPHPS